MDVSPRKKEFVSSVHFLYSDAVLRSCPSLASSHDMNIKYIHKKYFIRYTLTTAEVLPQLNSIFFSIRIGLSSQFHSHVSRYDTFGRKLRCQNQEPTSSELLYKGSYRS